MLGVGTALHDDTAVHGLFILSIFEDCHEFCPLVHAFLCVLVHIQQQQLSCGRISRTSTVLSGQGSTSPGSDSVGQTHLVQEVDCLSVARLSDFFRGWLLITEGRALEAHRNMKDPTIATSA